MKTCLILFALLLCGCRDNSKDSPPTEQHKSRFSIKDEFSKPPVYADLITDNETGEEYLIVNRYNGGVAIQKLERKKP